MEIPTAELMILAVGIIIGATAPTYYATERLRGFGRALFTQMPYAPPPGMSEKEALKAAAEQIADEAETQSDEK